MRITMRMSGFITIASMALACSFVAGCKLDPGTKPAAVEGIRVPMVWRVDVSAFDDAQRLAAVCLQGLANRERGRVFLDYGRSLRWLQIDYDRDNGDQGGRVWSIGDADRLRGKYPAIDAYWIDFYQSRGLARFETVTMPALIRALSGELDGVVLYGTVAEDLALVATMAGVRDVLPLTDTLYREWVAEQGLALPVRFAMSEILAGSPPGTDRRLLAHRWMIDHLYPECDRAGAVSRDRTYSQAAHDTLVDIDLAVCQRWVVFDLSFMSEESRLHNANDEPLRHPVWGFDPPDKPLLMQILDGLDEWAPVYGWGRPYESALTRRLAIHRCVKVCGGTANGSFYRYMPRLTDRFVQRAHCGSPVVERKFHIAFMTNEGDTLKAASSLVNGGSWLQSERGKLPVNWGVNPQLIRDTPGLMSYYYATATTNDYFFSATSGWGYLTPIALPDENLDPYARMVRYGGALADTRYIDVWWMNDLRSRGLFFPFLEAMGVRGLTQWSGRQEVEFAPDGTPVIHSHYYYPRMTPEALARQLIRQSEEFEAPWFIVIYGGNPHYFNEVMQRLPSAAFKAVKLDEFFEAARAARPLVEGRVWTPGRDVPVSEAP